MSKLKLLIASFLLAGASFADQVDTHLFNFSNTLETVSVHGALNPNSELAEHGSRFIFRVAYDYQNDPLAISSGGTQVDQLIDDIQTINAGFGILINPRILLGVDVPVHHVNLTSVGATATGASDQDSWTVGDVTVHAKVRLSGDDSKVAFAVMPYATLPTGDIEYFVSDDSYAFGGRFLVDTRVADRVGLYANAGYTHASNANFQNIDRDNRIEWGAAASIDLVQDKGSLDVLGLNLEGLGSVNVIDYEDDQNPIVVRGGLRAKLGKAVLFGGASWDGIGESESQDFSYYGGLKLALGGAAPVAAPEPAPAPEPTPEPTPEPKVMKEVIKEKLEVVKKELSVVREINFASGSAQIKPESHAILDSAAEKLTPFMDQISTITVHGHTDTTGGAALNKSLSQKRAEAVAAYLAGKGIEASKLKAVGHGEENPKVFPEKTAEDRRLNRRVEFVVKDTVTVEKNLDVQKEVMPADEEGK
ncbi:OmpA family protein [bacterium]|nr:OmpA family protein [bacterium]